MFYLYTHVLCWMPTTDTLRVKPTVKSFEINKAFHSGGKHCVLFKYFTLTI